MGGIDITEILTQERGDELDAVLDKAMAMGPDETHAVSGDFTIERPAKSTVEQVLSLEADTDEWAAARAAYVADLVNDRRAAGPPPPRPKRRPDDVDGRLAGAPPDGEEVSAPGANKTWVEPRAIPGTVWPVPAFDLTLLPVAFREWCADIAERAQCPIEYVAIGAMVSLAGVVGRRHKIFPKRHDDWSVVPNLWGAAVGPPGVMKTNALKEAMRPLERLAVKARESHQRALTDFEFTQLEIKAKKEQLTADIKRAVKDGGDASALRQRMGVGEPVPPTERRYIVNDTTVEKLGALLNENPNGVLMFRDELMGWLRSFDREGHESDRAFYLEAWGGDARFTYDRIGRGTLHIDAACVSVLGGIQPGPLNDYLAASTANGAGNDGLMQRFQLLVSPDTTRAFVNVDRYPDTDAKNRAYAVFERLDIDPPMEAEGWRFDAEGQAVFDAWREDQEPRWRNADDVVAGCHLAKYRSLMPSLALLLHLTDDPHHASVSGTSARTAVRWCELLEAHARRIYAVVVERAHNAARLVGEKIKAGKLGPIFTAREIYRSQWSGLADQDVVEPGLDVLVECGWIVGRTVPGTGRPKVEYHVNPKLLSK